MKRQVLAMYEGKYELGKEACENPQPSALWNGWNAKIYTAVLLGQKNSVSILRG